MSDKGKTKVVVAGGYQTKFGELWQMGLKDLIQEAGWGAIKDAKMKPAEIDLIVVGNKLSGRLVGQNHLGCLAAEVLNIRKPALMVEAACASGGVAVHQAIQAIKSGEAKTVLVIGVEKMTDKSNGEVAMVLMGAASDQERKIGLSFVGLYALMAQAYFKKFGATKKDLAYVAVKNHRHASLNPKAHFPFSIYIDKVMNSPVVAEPLRLFDCSGISDGAAAVVLTGGQPDGVERKSIEIAASQIATDSLGLTDRKSLVELAASKKAANQAYQQAGIKASQVDLAEVHDCFTIAEIMAVEDLGFCDKGVGYKKIKKGEFSAQGRLPVNMSGGLKACGHPVGATGVKQIVELVNQLKGAAGSRQVKGAKIGLAHNVGGTGGTAVVHILRKGK